MMIPKSILMTADTVGGVWTYALELTRALQPDGVEVNLALMGPPLTAAQRAEADAVANLCLFKSDYKLEWMSDCWSDVRRAGEWLLHLANRLRPDVIHLNGYAHANLPWNIPTLVAGHSCVFSWWQAVHEDEPPSEWLRYKSEVTSGLRGAHLVVTPTAALLRTLETHYGKIYESRVIPNGRSSDLFRPAEKQQLIFSAGRLWDKAKNVKSVAEIADDLPWPVFVAGSNYGPHEQMPSEPGIFDKHCHWLGPLPELEMRNWYGAASIYALPALYEPFGYTPLEAGLSACALVLGDIPSLREIWDDAAVFVEPHDSRALKSELLRLIENDRYRREMARRARERALLFNPARMGQSYLAAYSDLLVQFQPIRLRRPEEPLTQCA
jgi:glycogen(starch) synthase